MGRMSGGLVGVEAVHVSQRFGEPDTIDYLTVCVIMGFSQRGNFGSQ